MNGDDRKPVTLADLDAAIERIGHKQPILFQDEPRILPEWARGLQAHIAPVPHIGETPGSAPAVEPEIGCPPCQAVAVDPARARSERSVFEVAKIREGFKGVEFALVEKAPTATPEEIEAARRDPDAFLNLVMRRDPRPSPPAGAAASTWERHLAATAERQNRELEDAVTELARFIDPTDEERAWLRTALHEEARRLAETTGHTYRSALQRVAELLRGVAAVRPGADLEDLRKHLARLQPAPAPEKLRRAPDPVTPALPKRQRPRNKYAARPPGKR